MGEREHKEELFRHAQTRVESYLTKFVTNYAKQDSWSQVQHGIQQLNRVLQVEMRELLKSSLDATEAKDLLDVRLRKETAMHEETKAASQQEIASLRSAIERDKMSHQLAMLNLEKQMQQELSRMKTEHDNFQREFAKKANQEFSNRKRAMEEEVKKSKASWLQRTEQRLLERYHERLAHASNRLSLNCQQMLQKKEGELADQLTEKANLRCRQVESQNAALGISLEQEKVRTREREHKLCDLEATLSALNVELSAKNAEIEALNDQLEIKAQRHNTQARQITELQNTVQKQIQQTVVDHREAGQSLVTPACNPTERHATREQESLQDTRAPPRSPKTSTPPAAAVDNQLDARLCVLEHLLAGFAKNSRLDFVDSKGHANFRREVTKGKKIPPRVEKETKRSHRSQRARNDNVRSRTRSSQTQSEAPQKDPQKKNRRRPPTDTDGDVHVHAPSASAHENEQQQHSRHRHRSSSRYYVVEATFKPET